MSAGLAMSGCLRPGMLVDRTVDAAAGFMPDPLEVMVLRTTTFFLSVNYFSIFKLLESPWKLW